MGFISKKDRLKYIFKDAHGVLFRARRWKNWEHNGYATVTVTLQIIRKTLIKSYLKNEVMFYQMFYHTTSFLYQTKKKFLSHMVYIT